MTHTINGLNTACIFYDNNFLALCIKVKQQDESTSLFYFQNSELRDLLMLLVQYASTIEQETNSKEVGNAVLSERITQEEVRDFLNNAPDITPQELQTPEPTRRVSNVTLKKSAHDCMLYLITQAEQVYILRLQKWQCEIIMQAIIQALRQHSTQEHIESLTSNLDFLPLFDMESQDTNRVNYTAYTQQPWKIKLFKNHIGIIYCCKTGSQQDAILGAVVKCNALPGSPELESIAMRMATLSERLAGVLTASCKIESVILPAAEDAILTVEECLRPLNNAINTLRHDA